MATRKTKPPPAASKATPKAATERRIVRQGTVAVAVGSESNRLLREAAWSQMFGRVESKNPFTR
jgi:hypothetical protein